MSFPSNLEKLNLSITDRQSAAQAASQEAKRFKGIEESNQKIAQILIGLLNSWSYTDPGKYQTAFFFLNKDSKKRVVVREFLLTEVKVSQSREEWDEYIRIKSQRGANYKMVPYQYPAVNLKDIYKGQCEKCKSWQPVVERYEQTEDSPAGDKWIKERLVLCLNCNQTTTITLEPSSVRF